MGLVGTEVGGASGAVLAYVFWHAPAPGVHAAAYEGALQGFHQALQDHPPEGFVGSTALRVEGVPWLGGGGYEDWYLLQGFADLGVLNEAAVSGRRRGPHDDVALRSGHGAGGLYALWTGPAAPPSGPVTWCAKAPGTSYEDLRASLPATTWVRQLVLGPGPELCVPGVGAPPGASVVATPDVDVVWTASSPPGAVTPPA
jgi:hypothetical protein